MLKLAACAVLTSLCLASLAAFAQTGPPPRVSQRGGVEARGSQATFDPRDLSGYWLPNTVRSRNHPPLTPAGVAAMKGRIPNPKVRVPSETNERAWLDDDGNPKSFDAVYEERYTRTGPDTIEGQLTINDPKNFTAPWVHPKSTFRLSY